MFIGDYKPEGSILASPANREYLASEQGLERAMNEGVILEAMAVRCDNTFRLTVELGCMRGYIEREDVMLTHGEEAVRDIAVITRVGKAVCFKVMGFFTEGGRRVARLSRREAQRECYEAFLCDLIPGDVIDAKVTHLESFGAFVDVGCGIVSLLSIDCISVSRISHPSDRFRVGDRIRVVIKSLEPDTGRIFVSHKELLGTWEQNAALFEAGQTVAGTVRSIEPYGVFIELTPNLTGLAERKEGIRENTPVSVFIKSISPERMKIKLVIIDSCPQATTTACPRLLEPSVAHMDRWRYSPPFASKHIETVFSE